MSDHPHAEPPQARAVPYIEAWGLGEIAPGLFHTEEVAEYAAPDSPSDPPAPVVRHRPHAGVHLFELAHVAAGDPEYHSPTTWYIALAGAHAYHIQITRSRSSWATCKVMSVPREGVDALCQITAPDP
jgi:hypothetical protein